MPLPFFFFFFCDVVVDIACVPTRTWLVSTFTEAAMAVAVALGAADVVEDVVATEVGNVAADEDNPN